MDAVVKVCIEHASEPSPCRLKAWEGELNDKHVVVYVVEPEENTRLCGPAYNNELVIYNGDVMAVPRNEKWEKQFREGFVTGISFLQSLAAQAAYAIETAARAGGNIHQTRFKIVRGPGDINIYVDPVANRYITGKNRKIDVRGPVFTTIEAEISG